MNEDVIADLKQFIAATVSQRSSGFVTKDDLKHLATIDNLARLEAKIDKIQEAIGEALATGNDVADEQLKDHERRITTLVRQPHFAS